MATYPSKHNSTTCYLVFVKIHKFTTSDNPYAYNLANPFVYVRGFTGLTEQAALDSTTTAGGAWLTCHETQPRALRLYYSGNKVDLKIFARIEVYWPGLSQKAVKYSKLPVLCGFGTDYENDDYISSSLFQGNTIEVWLNGEKMNAYTTFGGLYKSIRQVNSTLKMPNYLSDGIQSNQQVLASTTATGEPLYKQFMSGSTTLIAKTAFSASTSENKYKTPPEIGWRHTNPIPCNNDSFTFTNCDSEYTETDCPSDDCPTDCTRVCNCDSETNCYNETCGFDCNTHVCQTQLLNQCGCYSIDTTPECENDLNIYDNCEYIPLKCVQSISADTGNVVIPYLNRFTEDNEPFPATAITYRLEGRMISRNSTKVANTSSALTRNLVGYNTFSISTSTGGYIKGGVSTSGSSPTFKGLTGLTYSEDVDITIGNTYIYDNLTGTYPYSGTTSTSTAITAGAFCINLYTIKLSRARLYFGENLVLDLKPVMVNCTKGSLNFETKYGLYDIVHNEFYRIDEGTEGKIDPCIPEGYDEGDLLPSQCLSGDANDYVVHLDGAVSGIPIGNTKIRVEGVIRYISSKKMLFSTYPADGTDTNTCRMRFDSYGYANSANQTTRFASTFTGCTTNTTNTATTEALYERDVDLTFGNRYVYNNANGHYVYSAATYTGTTNTHTRLGLNLGKGFSKIYRVRIYNENTLVHDFKPYAIVYNSKFEPALRDEISGAYTAITSDRITYCQINPEPIITGYILKCMNLNSVHYQVTYQEGQTIDKTMISDPTAEGRTFVQWVPAIPDVMPAQDFTTNAQYTVNQYTINYYVDGSLYTSQVYNYGTLISPPTEPTPPSGYIFSGWDIPYNTMPAFDVNVYATMDVYVPKYTINFYSGSTSWGSNPSCSKFSTAQYQQGETINYPTVASTCRPMAYGSWKLSCSNGTNAPATMPATEGLNVYCVIGWKTSTIHWMAKASGTTYTEYSSQTAEYKDNISSGPDLSSYAPEDYEWRGWGSEVPFEMPCEDKYVYGQFYRQETIYYTYTLYADGVVFLQRQYEEGDTIPYSGSNSVMNGLPTTQGSCSITWSTPNPAPSVMPASNVSANTYSSRVTHTLTYYVDSTVLEQVNALCGSSLTARALPSNPGYSYSAWSPAVPSTMPDSDISAVTTSTHIVYHIYYYKDNVLWVTEDHYYGDTITPHSLPTEVGKTYSAWNPALPSTMPANNISTYTSSAGVPYQIYYYLFNMSGNTSTTLYATRTFTYGQTVTPLAAASPPTGQSFSGWTGEPTTMPANNVNVSGWTIPISYTLTWKHDNTIIVAEPFHYNDTVPIRQAPGDPWVFTPSLMSGNKMPPENVVAVSTTPACSCDSDCTYDCTYDQCLRLICVKELCQDLCTSKICTDCPSDCICDAGDGCSGDGLIQFNSLTYTLTYSCSNTSAVTQIKFVVSFLVNGYAVEERTLIESNPGSNHSYGNTFVMTYPSTYEGMWTQSECSVYVKTNSGSSMWLGPWPSDGDVDPVQLINGSAGSTVHVHFVYSP